MSLRKKMGLLFCTLLGLACAYGLSVQQKSEKLTSHKFNFSEVKRTLAGKPNAMMEISIEPISGIPDHDEQEITLRASLTLSRPVDSDLSFKWILPEDVSVVAGHLEDGWNHILPGQTVMTEITLTGLSKESAGKAAVLHVESTSHGAKIGYSGVYAVNPETVQISDVSSGKLNKVSKSKEEIISDRLKGVQF